MNFAENTVRYAQISAAPMRGHPVFIAQHATACCCRGCLEKWHKIPSGRALTAAEQEYIVGMLLFWMQREMTSPLPGSRR